MSVDGFLQFRGIAEIERSGNRLGDLFQQWDKHFPGRSARWLGAFFSSRYAGSPE